MLALALLALGRLPARAAASSYGIDQRYGSIGFSVRELGLFSTDGTFQRFQGQIVIDPAHPEATRIAVRIAVASAVMSSERAVRLLLSARYFDAPAYPAIRFHSTSVAAAGPNHYRILGMLQIRNTAHPQELNAVLIAAKGDPKNGTRTAYFTITGVLHRAAFGMTANENFIGDVVHLMIQIHLTLPAPTLAG